MALDGLAVDGADELIRLLDASYIDRPAEVTILREGALLRRSVRPRERTR